MKIARLYSRHAFTLMEVLIAMTVSGFAMAAILALYLFTLQNNYIAEQRSLANDDVRFFTEKLVVNARSSNILVLYKSLYPYAPTNNTFPFTGTMPLINPDVNGDGVIDQSDRITPGIAGTGGGTGDYMVLISYSDPFPAYVANSLPNPTTSVTRLVLYWVAPNRAPFDGNTPGIPAETAMYMFDSNNTNGVLPWGGPNLGPNDSGSGGVVLGTPANGGVSLESILPPFTAASSQAGWAQVVLNDIRGLTNYVQGGTAGDGTNFTDYADADAQTNCSVLMESLILHGNTAKRVTDTYHFTITPGG